MVIDSEDECEENDAQLEEDYETSVDDEYIEEGRPWQYDREVTYDGLLNKYTFTLDGKKFTLLPLSPYEEFNDMFPHEDAPTGLPPLRGIEHQIDFIQGATLPNMAAYRTNPTETKEIQRQVEELMDKGKY
ncbi:uncharacterized protein E6C27_scaffold153G00040 [Cucumis melo var. makuwa]|uniref:Uncharacterized protein n=1 Tax=Cucumis melo var. makuwa TaxID=1194695 RepID=A0A5A7UMN0_CUCMM|nr:uncharacterized protein E6C27_scaffold153G00040 [Cucumis melo var. makuwa]